MNTNEHSRQFITELGLNPNQIPHQSLTFTSGNNTVTLHYNQYLLDSDGTPKRANSGHRVTTSETRDLTPEETKRARELGLYTD